MVDEIKRETQRVINSLSKDQHSNNFQKFHVRGGTAEKLQKCQVCFGLSEREQHAADNKSFNCC